MMRIIAVLVVLRVAVTQQPLNEEMLKVSFLLLKLGHDIAPEPLKKLLLFQVGEEIVPEPGPVPALSLSVVVAKQGRKPIHVRIQREEILKVSFFLLKVAHKTKESLKVPFLLLKLGLEIAPNHELNELFLKLGQEIVSEPEMQGPVLRVLSLADTQQGLEPFLVDIAQEEMFGVASFLYNSVQDSAPQPGEEHGPIPVMNERPSQRVSDNLPTAEEDVLAPTERCGSDFDCFPVCSEYGYCQKYGYKSGGSGYSGGRDYGEHGEHDQRGERADRGSCRTDADCWPVCSEYGYCQRSGYKPGDKRFPDRRSRYLLNSSRLTEQHPSA